MTECTDVLYPLRISGRYFGHLSWSLFSASTALRSGQIVLCILSTLFCRGKYGKEKHLSILRLSAVFLISSLSSSFPLSQKSFSGAPQVLT